MIDYCTITVKGNGVGRYGRPKEDVTGTVTEFLVDNDVFYGAVFSHLKECKAERPCDPQQVLEAYLARRKHQAKFKGTGSKGLSRLAMKYKRTFRDRVSDETVKEFAVISGDLETLFEAQSLNRQDMVRGLTIYFRSIEKITSWSAVNRVQHAAEKAPPSARDRRLSMAFAILFDTKALFTAEGDMSPWLGSATEEELDDLLKVAEVMAV